MLSSTLVFTLKSQASSIIPSVSHSISGVFNHIGDTQKTSDFDNNFQQAQQKGWKTGTWGTAKYYVDDQHNMYVGKGELQTGSTLRYTLGDNDTDALKTLTIMQPIKTPQDSGNLFSTSNGPTMNNSSLEQINGLENVDTSQTTTMFNMFTNDYHLRSVNGIENWDVSKTTNTAFMFNNDGTLQNINVSSWNVSNVQDMGGMFFNDTSLRNLDLSGWKNIKLPNSSITYGHGFWGMLNNTNIQNLTLGNNTRVEESNLSGANWRSGNSVLTGNQLSDGNVHPGTWTRQ